MNITLLLTNLRVCDKNHKTNKKMFVKGSYIIVDYSKEALAKTLPSGIKVAVPGKWHC